MKNHKSIVHHEYNLTTIKVAINNRLNSTNKEKDRMKRNETKREKEEEDGEINDGK